MSTERFLDLYVSETREHLQLLTRSILRLERGEAAALEEAFRAAHTIKGLAAAMGHTGAAEAAHKLEDRLASLRSGCGGVDSRLADDLLVGADAIGSAIEAGLRDGASEDAGALPDLTRGSTEDGAARTPEEPAFAVPAHTASILVVWLAADAAMPEARAELVRRAVSGTDGVLGTWPATGIGVGGKLRVFLAAAADAAAIEALVRRAGDIARVERERPGDESRPDGGRPATGPDAVVNSVRVDRARLDELAESIAELSVLHARAAMTPDPLMNDRAAAMVAALQRTVLDMRMVPVSTALERFGRLVRDVARSAGKEIDFQLTGGDIELDQSVLDALVDPLVHLLRNAVDHGIEEPGEREAGGKPRRGTIRIEVTRERGAARLDVVDDGRGIDLDRVARRGHSLGLLDSADGASNEEILRLLFQPGFSTAETVTELSGRGVGLDVVAGRIRSLGGAIEVDSLTGGGATFVLRVPITLAVTHALRVRLGEEEYALPITHVTEVVPIEAYAGREAQDTVQVRGDPVSLVQLGRVLGVAAAAPTEAVVAELGERRIALAVDRVLGHEQIVVKSFDAPVGTLPVFSGATLLADGRPALLIDPLSVL